MENSLPMEGRAIFTEDAIKGVTKDPAVVTSRAVF
jgi:hypothetical protein